MGKDLGKDFGIKDLGKDTHILLQNLNPIILIPGVDKYLILIFGMGKDFGNVIEPLTTILLSLR